MPGYTNPLPVRSIGRSLTPEEDAIGDPDDDDEIDDTLPADLWFRAARTGFRRATTSFTVYSPVR